MQKILLAVLFTCALSTGEIFGQAGPPHQAIRDTVFITRVDTVRINADSPAAGTTTTPPQNAFQRFLADIKKEREHKMQRAQKLQNMWQLESKLDTIFVALASIPGGNCRTTDGEYYVYGDSYNGPLVFAAWRPKINKYVLVYNGTAYESRYFFNITGETLTGHLIYRKRGTTKWKNEPIYNSYARIGRFGDYRTPISEAGLQRLFDEAERAYIEHRQ